MRTDRLLELADHIEGLEHYVDTEESGFVPILKMEDRYKLFHMSWSQFKCNAPCCTAGWADHFWGGDGDDGSPYPTSWANVSSRATAALGIDFEQARELFSPEPERQTGPETFSETAAKYNSTLTPKVVARALRHLAETGEVVFRP